MSNKPESQQPAMPGSISVGNITGSKGVAIGQASVTITEGGAGRSDEIAQAFTRLADFVEKLPASPSKVIAQQAVQGLDTEAKKGEQADEKAVGDWFSFLAQTAPDVFDVAVATFANPIAGLSLAFKKIADRARQEKDKSGPKPQ